MLKKSLLQVCVLLALVLWLGREVSVRAQSQPTTAAGETAAEKPTPKRDTLFSIVFSGGPVGITIMLILIGVSCTATYLVIENSMTIRRKDLIPEGLGEAARQAIARSDLAGAEGLCRERPSLLAAVLVRGLAEAENGWSEVEKALEEGLAEQAARISRKIEYLSVIGTIAPMLGLLGTVTGMILAFQQVASTEGNAGAAELAQGIYSALVTTVAGLVIAIPSLGALAVFRNWVDQLVAEAAYQCQHTFAPLKRRSLATGAPPLTGGPPAPPPGPPTPPAVPVRRV